MVVNVRGKSSRVKKGKDEAKGTDESGLLDEPESDFRSVWSADAQAHSSTLQSRVRGGGWRRTEEIWDWQIMNIALGG